MRILLAVCALAAATTSLGWMVSAQAAAQTAAVPLQARVGDKITVVGAPVGCQVVRVSEFDGRIAVECRRAGRLKGSYGTLLTGREAVLIRFESQHTARRVAVAVHREGIRECRRQS